MSRGRSRGARPSASHPSASRPTRDEVRADIIRIYQAHNPAKIPEVGALLDMAGAGHEALLLERTRLKQLSLLTYAPLPRRRVLESITYSQGGRARRARSLSVWVPKGGPPPSAVDVDRRWGRSRSVGDAI